MPCSCGFTTNQDKSCNGNHKIVKSVKDKILSDIEAIGLGEDNDQLNALGMKMLIIESIKKVKGI
jgi:hypothetical protein